MSVVVLISARIISGSGLLSCRRWLARDVVVLWCESGELGRVWSSSFSSEDASSSMKVWPVVDFFFFVLEVDELLDLDFVVFL